MSASDHLQPMQLQMFMPAGKLKGLPEPYDAVQAYQGNTGFMWDVKRGEASKPGSEENTWHPTGSGTSLRDSIAANGVKEAVNLYHGVGKDPHLRQGHHRVATAADLDPTMEVPVRHVGDPEVTQRHWRKDPQGQWKTYPL